ncbi:MAG: hypothetical protein AB1631_26670 [Acidobacteriota bacterium]
MGNYLRSILENCALEIRKDKKGWHLIAHGPLGVLAVVGAVLALYLFR